MTVLMHSYNKDIALVEWIRLVKGSISFLPGEKISLINLFKRWKNFFRA